MLKKFLFIFVCLSFLTLSSCFFNNGPKEVNIIFDSRGGSSVPSIKVEDDFDVDHLPVPTKEGYTFLGWYLDESFTTNIVGNVPENLQFTLYAKWETNSYSITYHTNGGSEISATTHLFGSTIEEPSSPTKEGYAFGGWFTDTTYSIEYQFATMPAQDLNLYALWMPNSYSITFDSKGGSSVNPITAYFDTDVEKPDDPIMVGYRFVGWYLDEDYTQEFTFAKMPLGGAHLYAKWEEETYKIIFVGGYGLSIEPVSAKAGEEINLPIPSLTGYAFLGWYRDEDRTKLFTSNTMPGENITLYAKWNSLMVTYVVEHYVENANDDGFSLYQEERKQDYSGVMVQATPLSSYWFEEDPSHEARVSSGEVKGDGTLVLKLYYERIRFQLTVHGGGGIDENGDEDVTIYAKYEETLTPPTFTRKGYRFKGWNKTFPSQMYDFNFELTALWDEVIVMYRVEHYQENVLDYDYTLIETTSHYKLIDHEVVAEFKNYLGFSVDSTHPDSKHSGITLADDALVLKVYYQRNVYTITFKDSDGSALEIDDIEAKYGAPINAPNEPTKEGYTFIGWYTSIDGTTPFEFTSMPAGGATLYARYQVRLYTITFVSNAEISVTSIKAEYNTPIQAPSVPIRQGYTFIDWFIDENCEIPYVFTVMPAEDITLYAKWEPNQVTVTFIYNDGRTNTVISGKVGEAFNEIIPVREGYTFIAWFVDASLQNQFTDWIIPTSSINLYAGWNPNDYTITFVTGADEVNVQPLTAPYESLIYLPEPIRPGYEFIGWFIDSELSTPFMNQFMPLNGATLYAKWEKEAGQNTIAYALSRPTGTLVTVQGIVYAKLTEPYKGFYIFDENDQIYCFTNQISVNIGDEISITGYFERWNDAPMINGVTSIAILSSNHPLEEAENLTFEELFAIEPSNKTFGLRFSLTGILINDNGHMYLVDPLTMKKVRITHQSYDRTQENITGLENCKITGEFVLSDFVDNAWEIAEINITEILLTDQEKVDLIKTYLQNLAQSQVYRPESSFALPQQDLFGWTTIAFSVLAEDQMYFDEETSQFIDSSNPFDVDFEVTITRNEVMDRFVLTIPVHPFETISIADFYSTEIDENQIYYLQGIVIRSSYNQVIIQDETGTFTFYQEGETERLELGTEVIISVSPFNYYFEPIKVEKFISYQNEMPKAKILSEEELINLTYDDYINYQGQYVELRGTFKVIFEEYNEFVSFLVGSVPIIIEDNSFNMDAYYQYSDMEVIIRGYLFLDFGEWYLIFDNNKHDFQIPTYTDSELVAYLQNSIVNQYRDVTFHSLDYFTLPTCHPVLGGKITWEMASESVSYYNKETKRFNSVTEPTPIAIDIVIRSNDVNISFTMNKILYPDDVSLINELSSVEDYEIVTVKGTVVFRHFDYFYLQDETGLIYVYAYRNTVRKGDYIRLEASKYSYYVMPRLEWDEDEHMCMVISSNNPFNLTPTQATIREISDLDPEIIPVASYLQVTGLLLADSGILLYYGEDFICIEPGDGYTDDELMQYEGQVVTLNVYLYDYNEYRQGWEVMYTGLANEFTLSSFTDQEKIEFIKASLMKKYELDYESDNYHDFFTEHPLYGGQIQYEISDDEFNVVNLTQNYLNPINENTIVDLTVTIQVGQLVEIIPIELSVITRNGSGETQQVTIAEFKASNGETLVVYAKIIGIFDNAILVEDETGMMFVNNVYIPAYNYASYINRYYYFTGTLYNHRGRLEMNRISYSLYGIGAGDLVEYIPMSLSEVVTLDHRDDSVFGRPVELTGTIIFEEDYYDYHYYITDGFDKVRIDSYVYFYGSYISNFIGYEVTIKGRIYGLKPGLTEDCWGIQAARELIVMKSYSNEEIVDFIGNQIIQDYQDMTYFPYEGIYLYIYQSVFPNAKTTMEVISGNDAIDFYDDYGSFYWTEEDRDVVFKATVTCGEVSKEFEFTIHIKGIHLSNLNDLFSDEPGIKRIYLKGVLIQIVPGGAYFLIDQEVYFIENIYVDQYEHEVGDEYIITGYKCEVDGETNLNFNIGIMYELGYYEGEEPEPHQISIPEIYQENPKVLERQILIVNGILSYDQCSQYYYLETLGERIYLRFIYSEASLQRGISIQNGYVPEWLLGREVLVKSLFPNQKLKGKYLLDLYGDTYDSIIEVEYSPAERVANAIKELKGEYEKEVYYSFDGFTVSDYWDNCELSWELISPEDEEYLYPIQYSVQNFKWVNETKVISYLVTVTYQEDGYDPIVETVIVNFTVHPRTIVTIDELPTLPTYEYYCIEGIIQEVNQEYDGWFILKDDTGLILVNTYGTYLSGVSKFEVGDEVIVYGSYTYNMGDPKPNIDYCNEVIIVSKGNPVDSPTAKYVTIQEVFGMDYLDPTITCTYITVQGEIVRRGSSWYGYYYMLKVGDLEIQIMPAVTDTINAINILSNIWGYSSVSITGYLYGPLSSYSFGYWYMTFSGIYEINN